MHQPPPPSVQMSTKRAPKVAQTPQEAEHELRETLNAEESFPPELPVKQTIGKFSPMKPHLYALNHPTTPLLEEYADKGCPTDCGPSWSKEKS